MFIKSILKRLVGRKLEEHPDPTPRTLTVKFQRPLTLEQTVRALLRGEVSRAAANNGVETFQQANDFDVDDDPDMISPHEDIWKEEEARFIEERLKPKAPAPPIPPAPLPPASGPGSTPPAAAAAGGTGGAGGA